LTVEGVRRKLKLQSDYVPHGFTASGKASGGIIFAGFGISAPKLGYDDFAGVDVTGAIVVVAAGHPDGENPHSDFAMISSARSKGLFARQAGAAAVVIVDPDAEQPAQLRYDNSPTDAGIIVLSATNDAVASLFAAHGGALLPVLEQIRKEKKPQSFAFKGSSAAISVSVITQRTETANILGLIEGRDPSYKEQVIVVGAHYDHLGWGSSGSLYRGDSPMIHNGADDNASGVAGLLELAQYFSKHPLKRSILFMGFAAEEMGTLGSSYWVRNPTIDLGRVDAMLNLDMIGRMIDSTRRLNVQGVGTSAAFASLLNRINETHELNLALIQDGQGGSDHTQFYLKGIPVLFFFTDLHTDYHRPSDDFENLNLPGQLRVLRFVSDVLREIGDGDEKPAFTRVEAKEGRQMRGFNVYVGTIPDYGATADGFKISGASPGSPADKAGLKAGDMVVQFGDTKVKNIYDYMNALGLHRPDEDVAVVVRRGEETVTVTVHLAKKR